MNKSFGFLFLLFRPTFLSVTFSTISLCLITSGCGGADPGIQPGRTLVTISGGNGTSNTNGLARASNFASTLLQRPSNDFNTDLAALTPKMLGGIMVYFQGVGETTAAYGWHLANEAAETTVSILNGKYKAYSLGYTTPGMVGAPKCGVGKSGEDIAFNGFTAAVGFTLNDTNCKSFTAFNAPTMPVPPVTLNICAGLHASEQGALECLTSPSSSISKKVVSVAFQFRTYVKEDNILRYTSELKRDPIIVAGAANPALPKSINSTCTSVTLGIATSPVQFLIAPPFQMPFAIYGFHAASCEGPYGTYLFESNPITRQAQIILPVGSNLSPNAGAGYISSMFDKPIYPKDTSMVNLFLRDFSTLLVSGLPSI